MSETLVFGLVAIVAILLIVGFLKKTLILCVMAVVLAAGVGVTQSDVMEDVASAVSSFFDGGTNPFRGDDYSDLIDDDVETTPNKTYEDLGIDY